MTDLTGKIAVVTGASRGLGQRVAVRLAREGAVVALVARQEAQLRETARLVAQSAGRSYVLPADLSRPESLDLIKSSVEAELGRPSILVNAAGIFGPIQLIKDSDPAAWIETIMANTVSAYLTCRAFVGGMIDMGWGRIVNVTSAASLHEPGPINSAYGTSKVALNQFTRHLAAEIAGTGVTANVIHPGDVKTDMWADIRDAAERLGPVANAYRDWARWVEQTGGDDPEKAADLVLDLMGPESASVNGQFLWIQGGLQAPLPSWGKPSETQPWRRK
jgi:NAD(P)-dependent dehydrogenase (short-subunit alcohol dehydrogenase family)